jgi:hypothetical protein
VGDVLQGAAADCNSAEATRAWFDSRIAHHFICPPDVFVSNIIERHNMIALSTSLQNHSAVFCMDAILSNLVQRRPVFVDMMTLETA